MHVSRLLICGVLILQAACTSNPKNIKAEYVSPRLYSSFSCEELYNELQKVQTKVDGVTKRQRANRSGDTAMVTVGIIGFPFTWPLLLGTALTKDHKIEIAQYMGQVEAIKENMEIKECAFQSRDVNLK